VVAGVYYNGADQGSTLRCGDRLLGTCCAPRTPLFL